MDFEMESGTQHERLTQGQAGQAHKQYKKRHGSLERVEAYGYIMCN